LKLNLGKQFSRKHYALARIIQASNFPDVAVLSYYAHPETSSEDKIRNYKPKWRMPDVNRLAQLCKELFEWDSRWGMCRFMRSFIPGYFLWRMLHDENNLKPSSQSTSSSKLNKRQPERGVKRSEGKTMTDYFKSTKIASIASSDSKTSAVTLSNTSTNPDILDIHGIRKHFSTDSTEELRLSYIPSQVLSYVPLNFNLTRYNAAVESGAPRVPSPTKSPIKRPSSPSKTSSGGDSDEEEVNPHKESKWSPDDKHRIWIPRIYVQHGLPEKVAEWERAVALKKSPKKAKATGGMLPGAMEQFVSKKTAVAVPGKGIVAPSSTVRLDLDAKPGRNTRAIPRTPKKQTTAQNENISSTLSPGSAFQMPPEIEIPSSLRSVKSAYRNSQLTTGRPPRMKSLEKSSLSPPTSQLPPDFESPSSVRSTKPAYKSPRPTPSHPPQPKSFDNSSASSSTFQMPPEIEIPSSLRSVKPAYRTSQLTTGRPPQMKPLKETSLSPPTFQLPPDLESPSVRSPTLAHQSPLSTPTRPPQLKSLDTSKARKQPSYSQRRWSISSSASDSDSLPSPTNLISFLFPSKVPKELGNSRADKEESPTKSSANDGNSLAGFKESPGGTLYEI
jgi:hypothetical protein